MTTPLQLLLLEDDPADAELILHFLRKSGLQATAVTASDEMQYHLAIRTRVFDAVLADNSLPQFSSVEALALLQQTGRDTAFILVTGTVSEEFAVDVMHKGADDYILKSNLARLPAAIKQAIERRRAKKEKREAEVALIQSERRYRTLFQRNLAGIYQSAIDGRITEANNAYCRMLGYAHASELRKVEPGDLYCTDEERTQFIALLHYEKFLSNHEFVLRRKDGSPVDVLGNITLVENQETGAAWIEGVLIDISDRRRAENEIREVNQELHDLSAHLQNIREEERTQIARDIHDELGQLFTALKMDIHSLQRTLTTKNKVIDQRFTEVYALIEQGIYSVRGIAAHLRPSIIDDLGLTAALNWHNEEVSKRHGLRIELVCEPEELIAPNDIVTGIFRIYQEALTNVVRHAHARVVHSSLKIANQRIMLEISDDGKGFDPGRNGRGKSFGILGMKERVFLMGGKFELRSAPGAGTSLAVSVPLGDPV